MSKVRLQKDLEELVNKSGCIPLIREQFMSEEEIHKRIAKSNLEEEFCFDLLVQMALHKRCNLPTLVGLLRRHFDNAQLCANALEVAMNADLVDYDPSLKVFITIAIVSKEIQSQIDQYQYPLPMLVEPKELTENSHTGYLVYQYGSVLLRDNHHEDDVCLDHLNRMNKVKLCIDTRTATMIKNNWRNLDKPKEGELLQEYRKRVKAFEKYDRTSKNVIDLLVQEGNEFYLTHAYDKRGRIYCKGYHVSYQGTAWNKAVIEFSEKEYI